MSPLPSDCADLADHGTAFDIAGTGKADSRSMVAAIKMAAEIADAGGGLSARRKSVKRFSVSARDKKYD